VIKHGIPQACTRRAPRKASCYHEQKMGSQLEIGNLELGNNLLAAPMAGISDAPYRYLAVKYGAGFTFAEMAASRGLIRKDKKTRRLAGSYPGAKPYAAQIFGEEPQIMAEAAEEVVALGADAVDLNAACPVKKVTKSGAGAALLKNLSLLAKILRRMRKVLDVPMTVKIRSGWDAHNIVDTKVARIARDEGANAITIHPRTASQGFCGSAHWSRIAEVVGAAPGISVIASGDVTTPLQALEVIEQTGAAGVMIGRAALGNPFIFREMKAALEGKPPPPPPGYAEKCRVALQHFDLMLDWYDERTAVALWRKHLCWYVKGEVDATRFRGQVFSVWDAGTLRRMTRDFFNMMEENPAEIRSVTV